MRLITKLIIAAFITEVALFIGISSIPYPNQTLVSSFRNETGTIMNQTLLPRAITIYEHNILIALLDSIPFFGLAMLGFSMIETALTLSAFSVSQGIPGLFASLTLMMLPHSWLELPSYAIASGSGLYIGLNFRDWKRGVLTLLIMPLELFIAALVESSEFTVSNPYLAWSYGAPALAGIMFLYYYIQKVADKLSSRQTITVPTVIQSQSTPPINTRPLYEELWKKAEDSERSGDMLSAMRNYWSSILNLISDYGIRTFSLKPVTLEDYYTVLIKSGDQALVSNFDSAWHIYMSNDVSRFEEFKNYIKYIKEKLSAR